MPFALLILVNALLILRPSEYVPGLEGAPLYEAAIVSALVASAGLIARHLQLTAAGRRPVTACVLGVFAAVVLSLLANGSAQAASAGVMFLKVVLYYLLVAANLRTIWHVRKFILWFCVLMMIQVGLALLQYFGYIDVEAFKPHYDREYDPVTWELLPVSPRLCGAGIFHDPNDLCVLLVVGVILTLSRLTDRAAGLTRFAWALPLGVFAAAIPLTHSRGGLLALMGGLGALVVARLGMKRGLLLGACAVPVLFAAVGERMTRIETGNSNDTSQQRVRAWSDGLIAFRGSPLFGVGQGQYPDIVGMCAHNTYVESYTELGFFGGTCFVAAFGYAAWGLFRLRRVPARDQHPAAARLRPYLLAIVVALCVGMLSLSRGYTPPTYLLLALAASYLHLAAGGARRAAPPLSAGLALRWLWVSAGVLFCMQILTVTLFQRS